MKIRTGFVSNSSASSFLLYGIKLEDEHINIIKNKLNIPYYEESEDSYNENRNVVQIFVETILYEKDERMIVDGSDNDELYLGISFKNIYDEETGRSFKTNIESILKETIDEDVICAIHEDAWND